MPNYDYQCPECSEEFEDFRTIAKRHRAECPQCGSKRAKLVIKTIARPIVTPEVFFTHMDRRSKKGPRKGMHLPANHRERLGVIKKRIDHENAKLEESGSAKRYELEY